MRVCFSFYFSVGMIFFFFYFSNYGLVRATRLRLGFINMYHVLDFFSN